MKQIEKYRFNRTSKKLLVSMFKQKYDKLLYDSLKLTIEINVCKIYTYEKLSYLKSDIINNNICEFINNGNNSIFYYFNMLLDEDYIFISSIDKLSYNNMDLLYNTNILKIMPIQSFDFENHDIIHINKVTTNFKHIIELILFQFIKLDTEISNDEILKIIKNIDLNTTYNINEIVELKNKIDNKNENEKTYIQNVYKYIQFQFEFIYRYCIYLNIKTIIIDQAELINPYMTYFIIKISQKYERIKLIIFNSYV